MLSESEEELEEEYDEETQRELEELGLGDIEGAGLLSPSSCHEIASAIGPGKNYGLKWRVSQSER